MSLQSTATLAATLLMAATAGAASSGGAPAGSAATDTAATDAAAPARDDVFDPAMMPEPAGPTEPLGYRYSSLTKQQEQSLRRGFRLPMAALARADSVDGLRRAADVDPLPNPGRPILPVDSSQAVAGDPFSGKRLTSFRDDPMRALGERLGATEEDATGEPIAGAAAGGDPFASSAPAGGDDPFASPEPEVSDAGGDADAAADDPFSGGGDPFTDGADPFGF